MKNFDNSRKQVWIDDERQLTSPRDLVSGQKIGIVTVFPGHNITERVAQAAFSLTGFIGNQSQGRVNAAKEGWQHIGLKGLAPRICADVERVGDEFVQLQVIAEPDDWRQSLELIGGPVEELPQLEEPYLRNYEYSELGLSAIGRTATGYSTYTPSHGAGLWKPNVTLLLE